MKLFTKNRSAAEPNGMTDERHKEAHKLMSQIVESIKTEEFTEGAEQTKKLLERFPDFYMAHVVAAGFYSKAGDKAGAMTEYATAIVLDPTYPIPYLRLAHIQRKRGNLAAAEAVLERGWKQIERIYPKSRREEERKNYFRER